jgi:hypothetical protein
LAFKPRGNLAHAQSISRIGRSEILALKADYPDTAKMLKIMHEDLAGELSRKLEKSGARKPEDQTHRRMFVLQVIQPGLVGLMDGSVSTLAPD